MTTAAAALLAELKRIENAIGNTGDGKAFNEKFGEVLNDATLQEFIEAGHRFAAKGFKHRMSVAAAWIYLGYSTAMRELGVQNEIRPEQSDITH